MLVMKTVSDRDQTDNEVWYNCAPVVYVYFNTPCVGV